MSEHHSGMTRSELSDAVGISYEDLSVSIVRDEEILSRYIVLAEALEDYDKAAWHEKYWKLIFRPLTRVGKLKLLSIKT